MAYNQKLANRIRERLVDFPDIEEKEMMGGLSFMLKGKMCMGVIKDEMVCRIDPEMYSTVIEYQGCRPMDFTGKPMRGWIMVEESGMKTRNDFEYWIGLALDFNQRAKAYRKKKK